MALSPRTQTRPDSGPSSGAAVEPWAIVVAGGSGARFGERKQLASFAGKRVIDWSLDALRKHVAGIVVVLPADLVDSDGNATVSPPLVVDAVVAGGNSRSASVRAGLAALPDSVELVLVHDAARPLADDELVARVVNGLATAQAVVPVVPITDSLRAATGGSVDRADFVAVQTPQGFSVSALLAAHCGDAEATDDASLIDGHGGTVLHVDGDPRNLKITVPHDLLVAESIVTAVAGRSEGNEAT